MQFVLYTLTLLFIDTFLSHFSFNLKQQQSTDDNKNLVYIQYLYITKHGLSTVEAQIWGFSKHAQAHPKGVAYKKKCVFTSRKQRVFRTKGSSQHKSLHHNVVTSQPRRYTWKFAAWIMGIEDGSSQDQQRKTSRTLRKNSICKLQIKKLAKNAFSLFYVS